MPAPTSIATPIAVLALAGAGAGQLLPGEVEAFQKISDTQGGLLAPLDDGDRFGRAVARVGDVDGDGVDDLAVGAVGDDDGGNNRGAVHVLFMRTDGTVKAEQKISDVEGGFGGVLDNGDELGWSLGALGDLDGDGVPDLAAGARTDDDGGPDRGAVWILFLAADGTVKAEQKISDVAGGFTGALDDGDNLGDAVTRLGDLDGDGLLEVAVGATGDDDGPPGAEAVGAVWILSLDASGTVQSQTKISATAGGLVGPLADGDRFGVAVADVGDLDGDGVVELAVGAHKDGEPDRGAVWILFLDAGGAVVAERKIADGLGGFTGVIDPFDAFGVSIDGLGDLDRDGVPDLIVGARNDDDGGNAHGAAWILFLAADGTVKAEQKISDTEGSFTGVLDDQEYFGRSVAGLGDLDRDGIPDAAATQHHDGDGGPLNGSCWVLFLHAASYLEVGPGLAGVAGVPALDGLGTLVADEPFTLSLTDAAPSAPAALFVGTASLLAPFLGGVLVPTPDLLVTGLPTDAAGALTLATDWPAGVPPGASLLLQAWIEDAAGPAGFSATPGLAVTTP